MNKDKNPAQNSTRFYMFYTAKNSAYSVLKLSVYSVYFVVEHYV